MSKEIKSLYGALDEGEKIIVQQVRYAADGAYATRMKELVAVANDLKSAGESVTQENILNKMEERDSEESSVEEVSPEEKQERARTDMVSYIEGEREKYPGILESFRVANVEVDAKVQEHPDVSTMTQEQIFEELKVFNGQGVKMFFDSLKSIDVSFSGVLADKLQAVYPKDQGEKIPSKIKFDQLSSLYVSELHAIAHHDLSKFEGLVTAYLSLYEHMITEATLKSTPDGDVVDMEDIRKRLTKIRDFWVAYERGHKQVVLLQEDLNTRAIEKDRIREEDQKVVEIGNVLDIFKDTVVDYKERAKKEGVFEGYEDVKDKKVKINEGALYFILRNISTNPINKGYVGAENIDIKMKNVDGKEYIEISIDDDGYGFEPERLKRVFDPGDSGATTSSEGMGYGMAYADKRLASMGCSIDIQTERTTTIAEDDTKYGTVIIVQVPIHKE